MSEKKGKKKKKRKNNLRVLGVVVVVIAVLASFYLLFTKITKYRMLEEKCKAIESSPDLLFPCKCKPQLKSVENESDIVYKKTEPMCICTCDIGNGTTVTIEVRAA